jgi:hypothetical protein
VGKRISAKADPRDLALEIVRRARAGNGTPDRDGRLPYVVQFSDPPTARERLQLAACRILQRPIAIMPAKCLTVEEWAERYSQSAC